MKKVWLSLILILFFLGVTSSTVFAQTYRFQVPQTDVNLYVNTDGSVSIEYTINFVNDTGVSAIDFIDIGTPNDQYIISSITADVDGKPITHIATSQYVTHGIELGLGSNAIQPGQSGTVHLKIGTLSGVLFPATQEESEPYASLQFSPNYFDSSLVHGSTNLTVTIFLPPGLKDTEPRYYPAKNWPGDKTPESAFDAQDRAYYRWNATNANSSTEYIFGASFPARLVPSNSLSTPPSSSSINLSGFLTTVVNNACCIGAGLFLVGSFVLIIYQGNVGAQKRKLQYLPPRISIEGHGIKRGLTAVEAAILMEQPMDKIMTMILFSVVKKSAATVETREPLKINVTDPLPEGLQTYEADFLNAFKTQDDRKRRVALQDLMVNLVKSVTTKIKGFSLKETVAYYQTIIDKAWQYVKDADTPEVQVKSLEEAFDWTLMDRNYEDRSRQVFQTRPIFVPIWWGRFDPTFHSSPVQSTASPISPSIPGQNISLPHLPGSDFAASVVKNVQNFSANVIGNVTDFTNGVTNKTNPMPKPSYSSGGGGGRSCACACACAGCACACAGGGR
jgi:hypothetical protein